MFFPSAPLMKRSCRGIDGFRPAAPFRHSPLPLRVGSVPGTPLTGTFQQTTENAISQAVLQQAAQDTTQAVLRAAAAAAKDVSAHSAIDDATVSALSVRDAPADPFTVASRTPLAGGVLEVLHWKPEGRMLRVWTPPGYSLSEAKRQPLPLLVLNDGQNLFDERLSLSGASWRAAEAASELITSGALPPFLICGVDHAGAQRSYDYLPYVPGTAGGFRPDAAKWPGGGVAAYLQAVVEEVLPHMERAYGASCSAALRAFGGSSFGGICTLCMGMTYPGVFGALLVESPSLWFADGKFLNQDLPAFSGAWPGRMYLAMGGKEYSGLRKGEGLEFDAKLVKSTETLAALLQQQSAELSAGGLKWEVDKGATHTESAWAKRLPRALAHLLLPWWRPVAEQYKDWLYFTMPKKLKGGQQAMLFFNKMRSYNLLNAREVQVSYGFNQDWGVGSGRQVLRPAKELQGQAKALQHTADWQCTPLTVPPEAYELHMAFSDGQRQAWDNNAGCNFYMRVRPDLSGARADAPIEEATSHAASWGNAQEIAHKNGTKLYFTTPETLVAGAPAIIYVNRKRLANGLGESPNVRLHFGFNNWESGSQELEFRPSSLWRGHDVDWWSLNITVPETAMEMDFAINNGHGVWDSNNGHNYCVPVKQNVGSPSSVPSSSSSSSGADQQLRTIASTESYPHAEGMLHIITMAPRQTGSAAEGRAARWTEEKRLRVWTPPGYDKDNAPPDGYPVLYMHDGQNKFEDWLAHQGVSWNVAHTASHLIRSGAVPPFLIVAVDSAGPMRSLNYLPYVPGTGAGGFRGDAERWPGGGLQAYMHRFVEEIIPLVHANFATTRNPAKVAMGGGSFAGVAVLYAAMHYPHVFGAILCESPSLWIAEGRFLGDLAAHKGMLPERLFLGCGTAEYSATRDHSRPDVDELLLRYCQEAEHMLREKGMRGDRLRFQVEEGAGHHEGAWRWRLTGALQYLCSPWLDE